jgi:23S rRNA pseudouridine1911/1915/1917 synthase
VSGERVEAVVERGGDRLDVAVARAAGIPRAQAARLVDAGAVRLNGSAARRSERVAVGDRLEIDVPEPPAPPSAEDVPVPVVYEDEHLVVVSKPAGLVVHPAPGHAEGTLVNALLAREAPPGGGEDERRPGIVHRLDAGTSGLMIVAKDEPTYERLREMMTAREVTRVYAALVEGSPRAAATIDAPIGRSPRHRKKMAVVADGREAQTTYRRLDQFSDTALLEVRPHTGRTHQIRVHLAAVGHAVVGDRVYGRERKLAARLGLERPFLHASGLAFVHPTTGAAMELTDPLPADLEAALAAAAGR